MELTALAGNAQIKAQLAHREGDLAHAYIVAGPAGSGRHTLAAQMAAALVCSAQPQLRPCGRCSHCRKAAGGIHPDITVIAGSGGKPITVDQVRALRTDAYVRPNEAERKVYLLERADRMNASAQNAMLKLLEDGPAYAVFFLLAENGSALLPTVRSRCETLELAPVSPGSGGGVAGQGISRENGGGNPPGRSGVPGHPGPGRGAAGGRSGGGRTGGDRPLPVRRSGGGR